eukprot:305667_1
MDFSILVMATPATKAKVAQTIKTAKKVLSPVINYFQDHLSVKPGPVKDKLELNYDWMAHWRHYAQYIPSLEEKIKTNPYPNEDCDVIIYVLNDNETPCGHGNGMLAWATPLHRDQYGRAISGIINFCDKELDKTLHNHYIGTVNTMLHELGHVLVVSDSNFRHFKNYSYDNIIVHDSNNNLFLTTPIAKHTAQEFYGCYDDSILPGIPIENQGGSATQFTHFDERFVLTSLMTGISYFDIQHVSPFFFAVAEDSGWYNARIKDASAGFRYGYKKGCEFFQKPCIDPLTHVTNWPEFFCDGGTKYGCTSDGLSIATCECDKYTINALETGRLKEASNGELIEYVSWVGGTQLNNRCPFYSGEKVDGRPH